MIAHTSIGVKNPRRVATVLAQLWKGHAMPFPVVDGGWMVLSGDRDGTMLEVVPLETQHAPGTGKPGEASTTYETAPWEVHISRAKSAPEYVASHVALVSPLDESTITAIVEKEGWRAVRCSRGSVFDVVEVWLENRYLVEVLTSEMAAQYRSFMTVENCKKLFEGSGA